MVGLTPPGQQRPARHEEGVLHPSVPGGTHCPERGLHTAGSPAALRSRSGPGTPQWPESRLGSLAGNWPWLSPTAVSPEPCLSFLFCQTEPTQACPLPRLPAPCLLHASHLALLGLALLPQGLCSCCSRGNAPALTTGRGSSELWEPPPSGPPAQSGRLRAQSYTFPPDFV